MPVLPSLNLSGRLKRSWATVPAKTGQTGLENNENGGHFSQRPLPCFLTALLWSLLLVVDELGYMPMDSRRANLFFQLLSARYEQGSIGVTTNKSFDQWGQIFGGDVIAAAILDRLLHHSHILVTRGPSYRMKDKASHLQPIVCWEEATAERR